MVAYEPFLVAPFEVGKDTDREPWLLPKDAFTSIINGHIHHGYLEKRFGFTRMGELVHGNTVSWTITSITNADPAVVTVTAIGTLANGDTITFRDVGGMEELNGQEYVIGNIIGNTFELTNTDTTLFDAYTVGGEVYLTDVVASEMPVMGLAQYIDSAGSRALLAFDSRRACVWNSVTQEFDPLDDTDIFSGSDAAYVWTCNWASTAGNLAATLDRLYFTNGLALTGGLDGIRYWDGSSSTTTLYNPEVNSPSDVSTRLNGAKLIFAIRDRLVMLYTIEGALVHPQRARWCQIQNPDDANAWRPRPGRGGFLDAPTGDQIISAQALQDVLLVFFTNSVWTLTPVSDTNSPFRWDKVNDFRGCDGKMASTAYDGYTIAAGIRGITANDVTNSQRIDTRIEDFISQDVNIARFFKVYAKRDFARRRTWMLFPKRTSVSTNAALIYDDESQAFSTYEIDMNVLGYGSVAEDYTLLDFGEQTIDSPGVADTGIDEWYFDNGDEIFVGGDTNGVVYIMDSSSTDNTRVLSLEIQGISNTNPGVVTVTSCEGLVSGTYVSISGVVGKEYLNDRQFLITGVTGNEFTLTGIDCSSGVYTSGGTVGYFSGDNIAFEVTSAGWNPYTSESKLAQLGYLDLYLDTNQDSNYQIEFYKDDEDTPYKTVQGNCLANQREIAPVIGVTNANPAVVSSPSHGLTTGDIVYIYGVEGLLGLSGPYSVTTLNSNAFSIPVDTTDYGVYTEGGTITQLPFKPGRVWKRFFSGATGYLHQIRVSCDSPDALRIHAFMPWFRPAGYRMVS